jgi:hypothetical protein
VVFFPPTAEMGVDGVILPFFLCLHLNIYEIFDIDSKQTKNLMKIQTCLWILQILTAKQKSNVCDCQKEI